MIRPGELFIDDRGRTAQLHGVAPVLVGDRWFAWGENKSNGSLFTAIDCYSSGDLCAWRFEGSALTAQGHPELGPDRVVERPKVLRRPDGKWILFVHIDAPDYSAARVGYAIADAPAGPFAYLGSERPLGNLSRDIGVFQEDGVGYLLSEDRDHGLHIYRLRDDYLACESIIATLRQGAGSTIGYESPALVWHDGLYYLFGSDLTGWSSNDNKVATSLHLSRSWSEWTDIAPAGSATFDSQVSAVVPLGGDEFLFVGDRWKPQDLQSSAPIWLPMTITGGRARVRWRDEWRPGPANA